MCSVFLCKFKILSVLFFFKVFVKVVRFERSFRKLMLLYVRLRFLRCVELIILVIVFVFDVLIMLYFMFKCFMFVCINVCIKVCILFGLIELKSRRRIRRFGVVLCESVFVNVIVFWFLKLLCVRLMWWSVFDIEIFLLSVFIFLEYMSLFRSVKRVIFTFGCSSVLLIVIVFWFCMLFDLRLSYWSLFVLFFVDVLMVLVKFIVLLLEMFILRNARRFKF